MLKGTSFFLAQIFDATLIFYLISFCYCFGCLFIKGRGQEQRYIAVLTLYNESNYKEDKIRLFGVNASFLF